MPAKTKVLRAANGRWLKGTPPPNPAGRPTEGESWAEIIKRVGAMTPAEAAKHCREIAGTLAKIGNHLTLKEAVVLRVYASLLFEPQPGLFNALMERAEPSAFSDGKTTVAVFQIVYGDQIPDPIDATRTSSVVLLQSSAAQGDRLGTARRQNGRSGDAGGNGSGAG